MDLVPTEKYLNLKMRYYQTSFPNALVGVQSEITIEYYLDVHT